MTVKNYLIGFILSLTLTFVAFGLVMLHSLSSQMLIIEISILALLQCAVQLVCFLHLGEGSDARDRAWALGVAALVVGILVVGSLWIMTHLNERMNPAQMQMYMDSQSGL